MKLHLLVCVVLFSVVVIQAQEAGDTGYSCFPSISIYKTKLKTKDICLSTIPASIDSCKDLSIKFPENGIAVYFHRNQDNQWSYTGTDNEKGNPDGINIIVSSGQEGLLHNVSILFDSYTDSSIDLPNTVNHTEIPQVNSDTSKNLDFILNESTYLCAPVPQNKQFTTFAPVYGNRNRGQVLNHPQLVMHHYGFDRRMPSNSYVWEYSLLAGGEHILHPPKMKYEDLKQVDRITAFINKHSRLKTGTPVNKKKNNSRLFRFKPL